jgi:hypothetical protein
MSPVEIVPGLLRWTAPHPDWNPKAAPGSSGDWDQNVGSVFYEMPDAVALIDPLLPSEDRRGFLRWLDGRIATRPVSVLTTIRWHRRDREELASATGRPRRGHGDPASGQGNLERVLQER